jgi:hypothetical protein
MLCIILFIRCLLCVGRLDLVMTKKQNYDTERMKENR